MLAYPCLFDLVRNCDKQLLILLGILAANKDLDGEAAALELIQMFG